MTEQRTGATRAARPAAFVARRRNRVIAGTVAAFVTAGFVTAGMVQLNAPAPTAAAALTPPSIAEITAAQPQSYQANLGQAVASERNETVTSELEPEPTPEPEPEVEPEVAEAPPAEAETTVEPQQEEPAPAPAPKPQAYTGGSPQAIAQSMMSADEFHCFDYIISHESGWNPHAQNPSSGAYGLAQALPGSKMATHGADWATNPATQIAWAMDYMKGRYGSICGAYNFWTSNRWY